ncbi:hypothetical protein WG904_08270 [Pedobacter sp. Du54]|uniref:hypothetical protein n=1 Tax=Pedobacter anseongensis TaxID=3133439 RepID=UPI00309D1BD7
MNKEQEQGLFNQIEEVLQTHEETYELGAWEEFDANRKKKKQRWPMYTWAAAAIILLCLGFGLFEIAIKNTPEKDNIVVKHIKKQQEGDERPVKGEDRQPLNPPLQNNPIVSANRSNASSASSLVVTNQNPIEETAVQIHQPEPIQQHSAENSITAPSIVSNDKSIVQQKDKFSQVLPGAYDSLANRKRVDVITEKSESKLTYSLVVSPSVSNQKVNFGAGMELSYKVGRHFSINGGLMYTSLNAKSNGKSLAAANTTPESANLAVSGLELPLGIQYQTSGGFYASAGVSALGLLKDKLEYNFLEEKTVALSSPNAGLANDVYKVVSERKTEESIAPLNNYMGFFNFSAGKKQAIGNLKLNIGPFVKVPFSSVSSENIKLLQGGIKLSVDF